MKIITSDLKKGKVKLKIENFDDLWYLSHIIDLGDTIKGKTFRKIKLGGEQDRSSKIIKKPVTLGIAVEKIEFSKASDILRVSGKIISGPEDISLGSYHTFNLEDHTMLSIHKENWLKFQRDKLKEASQQKTQGILICVFDRDHATMALLKKYGFEVLSEFTGQVQKKSVPEKIKDNFTPSLIKKLEEYLARYKLQQIVLASPAFFKDDLLKLITNPDLKKRIILATCNDSGKSGINEVLKRPEINQVLKQERTSNELNLVEKLLSEISKDNLAAYGKRKCMVAGEAGAIVELLLTDKFIKKSREQSSYGSIDALMKLVDSMDGKIHIISSDHQGGKKLDGLGGIAALLRYKIS